MENLLKHKLEKMLIFDRKILEVANGTFIRTKLLQATQLRSNGKVPNSEYVLSITASVAFDLL